ncbi:hypothetical protein [Chitinophaga nivalis]|uniref:Uncharacterized protein n=1 Tax=Chitinophaga nivalis TaxID=2991709 RepID=A0ABT3IFT2_9BACT|nr:hypothetical protein [Chitinophaga nivalis]MCW3467643.1 hypothetical protein [Chitinophaga nivalis]MCW3482665.1 hypothetical protein [Chitinophaga nivalis]
MALDKNSLKQQIKNAFKDMKAADVDEEQGLDIFCTKLAEAVDTYVKTATINYTTGLLAPNGAVTGVFNGNLS